MLFRSGDGRFSYDRIGRGTIDIEAACVSILGGIQPGPLTAYMASMARGGTTTKRSLSEKSMNGSSASTSTSEAASA